MVEIYLCIRLVMVGYRYATNTWKDDSGYSTTGWEEFQLSELPWLETAIIHAPGMWKMDSCILNRFYKKNSAVAETDTNKDVWEYT